MKREKTYEIVDSYFKLEIRLKQLENLFIANKCGINHANISSFSLPLKKCRSSYNKIELATIFYILMDEGILYFDLNNAKKNRASFQEFISENFTYNDNECGQKLISTISRQFSECKGYTYKAKQLKFLDQFIIVMQERKRRLESW